MKLTDLKNAVPDLADHSHNEKIKLFGWYLHTQKAMVRFRQNDIRRCYSQLSMVPPSAFGPYFAKLVENKQLLKSTATPEYKLESRVRDAFDVKYGTPEVTVKVNNLLADLAAKIPDMAERAYYQEALICYKHGSMRGAVIMTWNVAFSHLCEHILAKRLTDFNARWVINMPGKHNKGVTKTIKVFDDFNEELKEAEVLTIARDAGIINKNIYNIMHAALGRRNAAAHPNKVVIDKIQTDAYIVDLVTNVVQQIS